MTIKMIVPIFGSFILSACGGGSSEVPLQPDITTIQQARLSNAASLLTCSTENAQSRVDLNIVLNNSSSNWLVLDNVSAGEYVLTTTTTGTINGHTLNIANDWTPDAVFQTLPLSTTENSTRVDVSEGLIIVFVSHPVASTGAAVEVRLCTAENATEQPGANTNSSDQDNGTNPGSNDSGNNNDPSGNGFASGLPKTNSTGALVSAQASGLPLAFSFDSSNAGYWFNHPGVTGTLTQSCVRLHDSYWTTGPDGKAYPTWHPPIATTPTGERCVFGHEHGDNPQPSPFYSEERYSDLKTQGFIPVPFGYANEVLAANGGHRHEDHFGHKIFRENFRMAVGNSATDAGPVTATTAVCDALLKLHQGTHSADGLTNHLHEAIAHVNCGALPNYPPSRAHVTALAALGRPGWYSNNCSVQVPGQTSGTRGAGENNAPAGNVVGNPPIAVGTGIINFLDATQNDIETRIDGERVIPNSACVNTWQDASSVNVNNRRFGQAMNDTWVRPLMITGPQGQDLRFYLKSYYSVFNSSRTAHVASNNVLTTLDTVDACRNPPAGSPPNPSDFCQQVLSDPSITVHDVRSPYNGTIRNLNFKTLDLTNNTGSTTLWTDAFGREVNTTDPALAIRQYLSQGYNGAGASQVAGTLATPSSNKVCRSDSGLYPNLATTDDCYWGGGNDLLFAKEWWRDHSDPAFGIHSPN